MLYIIYNYIISVSSECRESTGIDFIELNIGFNPDSVLIAKIAEITDASGMSDPAADGNVTV